ncbi:TPA: hypothetical protein ACNEZ7_003468 [Escherichia coli]
MAAIIVMALLYLENHS